MWRGSGTSGSSMRQPRRRNSLSGTPLSGLCSLAGKSKWTRCLSKAGGSRMPLQTSWTAWFQVFVNRQPLQLVLHQKANVSRSFCSLCLATLLCCLPLPWVSAIFALPFFLSLRLQFFHCVASQSINSPHSLCGRVHHHPRSTLSKPPPISDFVNPLCWEFPLRFDIYSFLSRLTLGPFTIDNVLLSHSFNIEVKSILHQLLETEPRTYQHL
jgi:hypothetical protein